MNSALPQTKDCDNLGLTRRLWIAKPIASKPVAVGAKENFKELENDLNAKPGVRECNGLTASDNKGDERDLPANLLPENSRDSQNSINKHSQPKQRSLMDSRRAELVIEQALNGERTAIESLVNDLTPVIQNKVARVMLSTLSGQSVDIRQEVQDMTQDVLTLIFSDGGKLLRSWAPEKGASLPHFIAVVTERRTLNKVKTLGRRSRFFQDAIEPDESAASRSSEPEGQAISSQLLLRMTQKLAPQLSDVGEKMFDYLFLQGLSVTEICDKAKMSEDAVYAWRSRLRKKLKVCIEEIDHVNKDMAERRGGER